MTLERGPIEGLRLASQVFSDRVAREEADKAVTSALERAATCAARLEASEEQFAEFIDAAETGVELKIPADGAPGSYGERIRAYFVAHPGAELTAKQLEGETGIPSININKVFFRHRRSEKRPDGIYERLPDSTVYRLLLDQ